MTSFAAHHLTPPIAAAVERLGWHPDDPAMREAAPTAARGHNLVVVAPPSPAYASPALAGTLSRLGPGTRGLLLCSEAQLGEWGLLAASLGGESLRIQVARGTARAMRRIAGLEDMTLIALTGWGADSDRQKSSEAGFDQHLTKPVQLDVVQDLLARLSA